MWYTILEKYTDSPRTAGSRKKRSSTLWQKIRTTTPLPRRPKKTEPEAKKDALATALAQIEKQFGKGAVMKLGDNASMQVDAISTGSLGLDLALGVGGVPRGRHH